PGPVAAAGTGRVLSGRAGSRLPLVYQGHARPPESRHDRVPRRGADVARSAALGDANPRLGLAIETFLPNQGKQPSTSLTLGQTDSAAAHCRELRVAGNASGGEKADLSSQLLLNSRHQNEKPVQVRASPR